MFFATNRLQAQLSMKKVVKIYLRLEKKAALVL